MSVQLLLPEGMSRLSVLFLTGLVVGAVGLEERHLSNVSSRQTNAETHEGLEISVKYRDKGAYFFRGVYLRKQFSPF